MSKVNNDLMKADVAPAETRILGNMLPMVDRRVLRVKEQRTNSEYFICISKINEVVATLDNMGRRSCVVHMEGTDSPIKVQEYSAEDIIASCGFVVVEAKHQGDKK